MQRAYNVQRMVNALTINCGKELRLVQGLLRQYSYAMKNRTAEANNQLIEWMFTKEEMSSFKVALKSEKKCH